MFPIICGKYGIFLSLDNTFANLWENSADDTLVIFFLFSPENIIWNAMQIVSTETICMKFQIMFPGTNRKLFESVVCWKFYP